MDNYSVELSKFTQQVIVGIGLSMMDLDVTDDRGRHPVVVALDTESLYTLVWRLNRAGGSANLFSKGDTGVRMINVVRAEPSSGMSDADDLTAAPPSGVVSVGAFLDYLETQTHGVLLPSDLKREGPFEVGVPREIEFAV